MRRGSKHRKLEGNTKRKAVSSDNGDKTYTYLVEAVYNRVHIDPESGQPSLKIEAQPFPFTDSDKSKARQKAASYAKEILRDGLSLSGGSLISSVITTGSLLQVGIVDREMYEEEQRQYAEEMERQQAEASIVESVTAPVAPDSTEIADNEAE